MAAGPWQQRSFQQMGLGKTIVSWLKFARFVAPDWRQSWDPCQSPTVADLPEHWRAAARLLAEADRRAIIDRLAAQPADGELIEGTGGVRKHSLRRACARPATAATVLMAASTSA